MTNKENIASDEGCYESNRRRIEMSDTTLETKIIANRALLGARAALGGGGNVNVFWDYVEDEIEFIGRLGTIVVSASSHDGDSNSKELHAATLAAAKAREQAAWHQMDATVKEIARLEERKALENKAWASAKQGLEWVELKYKS